VSDEPVPEMPEPEPYRWRNSRDRDADVLGVVSAALLGDYEAAVSILESLSREDLVSLTWCISCWYAGSLAQSNDYDDPLEMVRRIGLVIGSLRKDDEQ
jgi:hypothetical protein